LHEIGFDIVHPIAPESNDIFEIKRSWAGKIALIGNIPTTLLGSSTGIVEGIPPENLVAMTKAVHKYGRYGALGQVSESAALGHR
jgi:uroporphyrinogen-III decarboxylase